MAFQSSPGLAPPKRSLNTPKTAGLIIFLIIPKQHPITITKRSPYPFGKDGLDEKKRQSFDCLLVREAGLEPARP